MTKDSNLESKYSGALAERQKYVDAILTEAIPKKIVVAGPGTGKTFLFKKVLENKKKSLTLTFVNALVEDLSLELYGLSEVRTLHSFARGILAKKVGDVQIFPRLSEVIKDDARILLGKEIDFDHLFHNRKDGDGHIDFYQNRKKFYGTYYGYSDIVFDIVKHFEEKEGEIPSYEQVVVDEFQDFNPLEVSLIDLLSHKSPILLAGDDDQALYVFKSASAEHMRKRFNDREMGFAAFSLPFCSRCPRVVVDAANDIISVAKKAFLKGRIDKPFHYFEEKKKDEISSQNPQLAFGQVYAKQMPWFISTQISEIAEKTKGLFTVLIISPTKTQSRQIVEALRNKGFSNIEIAESRDNRELALLDGLKILLADKKSNLGWRIVCKSFFSAKDFQTLLRKTNEEKSKNIFEIVNNDIKKEVKGMLETLRAISDDGENVDEKKFCELLKRLNLDPNSLARSHLKDEVFSEVRRMGDPGLKKIPIKATTIQSSKGLAADYVFITYFDDQYFVKDKDKQKISEQDICNFLVALTRARKKVFLISSNKKEMPTFLKWINKERIEMPQ